MSNGEKKRFSPLAWALIGCGGTALITVLILVGLMMFGFFKAREIVEEFQEDPAKVISDWGIETDDYLVFPGSRVGDMPDWVPIYRKAEEVEAIYTAQTPEGTSGTVKYETIVSAEILLGFYRSWVVEEQYQFQENDAVKSPESAYFSLLGEHKETGRSINMGITEYQGRTKVTINHMAAAD